ncbi:MAG TPA: polysaccharide pyruvyl transferase family protein [Candidatus Limnocylindrales bacterium]|jgi:hypothetical protein|nr:polysaccharide pyruvyl transferase family protein [Candidatus Limnocylindrales bacterium]
MTTTKSRLFYIGAPLDTGLPPDASVVDLLRETGNNTGNLLIGSAIRRHLKAELVHGDLAQDPHEIRTNFDCIVIGASNYLCRDFDFGEYACFVEKVNLPCVMIGLGAQAPDYGCRIDVPEGTQRMVRAVSERSASIGVRGYFSASILIEMGIKNVRVIGCPSMYWRCEPTLQFTRPKSTNGLSIGLNGSANVVSHSANLQAARKVEASLARLSFERGYPYILQNEKELMEIASQPGSVYGEETIRILMENYGLESMSPTAFVEAVKRNMTFYGDVETWLAGMQRFDFVTGSRFHGCLMGLLAGVPCQLIVHDARTREMCELMGIPHVPLAKAPQLDVRQMYECFDSSSVSTAYRYLYQNYIDFLEENGLQHRLRR